MAGQVISKADARAEALAVVIGLLGDQGSCQRAECGSCLKFLEGAAVGDVRAADKVEVFVPAQAEVYGQALAYFPVILEIQAKLLRVSNDERGIANRLAHALRPGQAS